MVVMDPDEVFRLGLRGNLPRIDVVDPLVGSPVDRVKIAGRREIMKERPQNLVGKAVVKAVDISMRKRHRAQSVADFP